MSETYKKEEEGHEAINIENVKENDQKSFENYVESSEDSPPSITLYQLFRFADTFDLVLIAIGFLAALGCGSAFPIMCIFFGEVVQAFVEQSMPVMPNTDPTLRDQHFWQTLDKFGICMLSLGLSMWIFNYVFVTSLNYAAERQIFRVRTSFLEAVLRQDITWYDTNTSMDFASKMTENMNKMQEGLGEKLGMLVYFLATFLISLVVAFIHGWLLTLVILSLTPLMAMAGAAMAKAVASFSEKEMAAYSKAGAIAEEVLSSVRTVVAFGGQEKEVIRYKTNLKGARRSGILRSSIAGGSGGVIFGIMYFMYGLGFWYGVKLIVDDRTSEECILCILDPDPFNCFDDCVRYDTKTLIIVLFGVLIGGLQVGQSAPYAEALAVARSAAASIYHIIDRVPPIDSSTEEGIRPSRIEGNISFKNVHFNYPSRKDVKILRGLTLEVPAGKTVALVGASGCGKSTCVQLLQRFYDVDKGVIRIDGEDVRKLNVGWVRDNIGVVGQEPVLFDCTISQNVKYGNQNAAEEDVIEVLKKANAFDFVMKLPEKMNTRVGEGGTQLSGGQKQRIAIARALIRKPQILLLDEATSALDLESEGVVQAALDKARHGRTSIIVAHRLSTIRSADIIIALKDGCVMEQGSHEELMERQGLYHDLVTSQLRQEDNTTGGSEVNTAKPKHLSNQLFEGLNREGQEKRGKVEDDDEEYPKVGVMKLLEENSPEWPFMFVGVVASCAMGAIMPVFALIFGDVMNILSWADQDAVRNESLIYMLKFFGLGLGSALAMFLQGLCFGISGQNLTMRLRSSLLGAMLRQEIGWFDEKRNNTGALCARLAGDAAKVQAGTGTRLGIVIQGISGMVISLTVAIYFSWKLGLVTSCFFPVLVGATYLQFKVIFGVDSVEKDALEKSAKLAIEAISNIRTVAGLRCEKMFTKMYVEELKATHKVALNKSHVRGIIFGFSQSVQFFGWGACVYYGGHLFMNNNEDTTFPDIMKVGNAVLGTAQMIGFNFAFNGDFNTAMVAAARVFHLLERKPKIDANKDTGLKLPEVKGNIEFIDADFVYPTREDIEVLSRLNLAIEEGQNVALVGHSGCGKSTVIQLIQRLYDLHSGSLLVEDRNIDSLNLPWVRSCLGLVAQEPVLFDRTIRENIEYGDNTRQVTMEEVMEAAREANIHKFVAALPEGYETRVGGRGAQLSGGQKQRVAIARALVRKPPVLLLDEATSALDSESEKIVQSALDTAGKGRTCITIAHRLSTIQGADVIFVIEAGKVAEFGTHGQLLKRRGLYNRLWTNKT